MLIPFQYTYEWWRNDNECMKDAMEIHTSVIRRNRCVLDWSILDPREFGIFLYKCSSSWYPHLLLYVFCTDGKKQGLIRTEHVKQQIRLTSKAPVLFKVFQEINIPSTHFMFHILFSASCMWQQQHIPVISFSSRS